MEDYFEGSIILDEIHQLLQDDKVRITNHFFLRLHERKISFQQVLEVLENGKIIIDYPDEQPLPCYLILGKSKGSETFHVLVGVGEVVSFITAYRPDPEKWSNDFSIRKEL